MQTPWSSPIPSGQDLQLPQDNTEHTAHRENEEGSSCPLPSITGVPTSANGFPGHKVFPPQTRKAQAPVQRPQPRPGSPREGSRPASPRTAPGSHLRLGGLCCCSEVLSPPRAVACEQGGTGSLRATQRTKKGN